MEVADDPTRPIPVAAPVPKDHPIPPSKRSGNQALLGAALFDAHELQLGRLLLTALSQDLQNGSRFAAAVLESAQADPTSERRAEKVREHVPKALRPFSETPLHALTIGKARRVGRVDLTLQSPADDWELAIELKSRSKYGEDQLERYLAARVPLVGLVGQRSPDTTAAFRRHPSWLGEALWSDVEPMLRELSWPRGGSGLWKQMLERVSLEWTESSYEEIVASEQDFA